MIPSRVYLRPVRGAFVFHDSLLPEYRGFAPTVWAIINGEKQTGVTLFAIGDDVDAGDIVDQRAIPIGPDSTISEVMERVTETYLELLERNLQGLLDRSASRRRQDHARATFTCKRIPQDSEIDWFLATDNIYNLIRASGAPYPGAYTFLNGKKLIIWSAAPVKNARRYAGRIPGRVVEIRPAEGSIVLTGDGLLLIQQVQIEGGDPVCAADVLKRLSDTLGTQ
jgi:methionyl-tRNA formyltransferase